VCPDLSIPGLFGVAVARTRFQPRLGLVPRVVVQELDADDLFPSLFQAVTITTRIGASVVRLAESTAGNAARTGSLAL
jgi:hypothetical protein